MSGVSGGGEVERVVARLRGVAGGGLRKELRAAITKAIRPLRTAIVREVPRSVPSGYGPVLAGSLVVRTSTALSRGIAVTVRVSAKGKAEDRDVRAVNNRRLRHPVFGDRDNWVVQPVRGGFVDRPAERLGPQVTEQIGAALDRVADEVEG